MIITKTPFRISFVGGGSDLEAFYSQTPGAVLSTTIDKYMYISSHQFFEENKIRAKYADTETVDSLEDLKHPIIRETFKKFNINGGLEVSSIADIPSGTGMGSSSSFTVGLFHNLYTYKGQFASKKTLAEDACHMEIDTLKEPIGKQDQYAAAYGGLNIIRFLSNGKTTVEPIYLNEDSYNKLQNNLILFYIGSERKASDILGTQKKALGEKEKHETVKEMVKLVDELKDTLYSGNIDDFGKLLHENWLLKQKISTKISSPEIQELYQTAMNNGALGGKLLGAGGGGFMLFYCKKEDQNALINAMPCRQFEFSFENEGSKLIYYGGDYG
ncbi:MAG: GHMP kinase [Flavobacteriales bacterium]